VRFLTLPNGRAIPNQTGRRCNPMRSGETRSDATGLHVAAKPAITARRDTLRSGKTTPRYAKRQNSAKHDGIACHCKAERRCNPRRSGQTGHHGAARDGSTTPRTRLNRA
jgi:hypothetical protein